MDVVFGDAPVGLALAHHLAQAGSVVLACPRPVVGPFLWRHADLHTGRGAKQAVEGARRVFVAVEEEGGTDGLFLVLRRVKELRGAVAVPLGVKAPRGLAETPSLARVHHGPAWGPEDPLVASWASQVAAGRRVWVADPGPVRPLPMPDLVAALEAAATRGGVQWTLAGAEAVRLPELADELARRLDRPARTRRVPLRWAAWAADVDPHRITRWLATPVAPTVADGWLPPSPSGRAGWLGDADRWRSAAG